MTRSPAGGGPNPGRQQGHSEGPARLAPSRGKRRLFPLPRFAGSMAAGRDQKEAAITRMANDCLDGLNWLAGYKTSFDALPCPMTCRMR